MVTDFTNLVNIFLHLSGESGLRIYDMSNFNLYIFRLCYTYIFILYHLIIKLLPYAYCVVPIFMDSSRGPSPNDS